MNELLARVQSLRAQAVETAAAGGEIGSVSDAELVELLSVAGQVQRLLDGVLTEAIGEIDARSDSPAREERLTTRFGCSDVPELIERTTRCSRSTATRYRRAAKATRPETSIVSGELLPAPLPATRAALLAGDIGLDGVLAVAAP